MVPSGLGEWREWKAPSRDSWGSFVLVSISEWDCRSISKLVPTSSPAEFNRSTGATMGRQGKSGRWRRKFNMVMSLNWVWDVSLCLRVLIGISMFQLMIKSGTNFVFWKKYNHHHLSAESKFQVPQGTSVTSHSIKPYIHNGSSIQTCLWCSLFYKSTVRDWQLPSNNRKVKVKLLSHVQLCPTPWTVAYYTPLSMGFPRQEFWRRLPFPSSADLPDSGIKPGSPKL